MKQITSTGNSAVTGSESVIKNTKNEPVVGRNFYHRTWPCKGAKRTPWLWIGRTKEVRTSGNRDDSGGYRRLAAIEGWVYTRPCRIEKMTFYFVYPLFAISVPDTSECPWLRFIHWDIQGLKTLNFQQKTLDYMRRKREFIEKHFWMVGRKLL